MRAAALFATLAVAGAAAAGCGGDDPDPETEVRATLTRYAQAVRAKDYDTLCDELFVPELLAGARAQNLPCETALETGLGDVRRPTLRIRSVRVQGERGLADAVIRTDAANQPPSEDTVRLVRRDGRWRIVALSSG